MSRSLLGALVPSDILTVATPARLAQIASRHGVGERTVLSDVDRSRTWLESRGYALTSAGTRGVRVRRADEGPVALVDVEEELEPFEIRLERTRIGQAILASFTHQEGR